MTRKNPYTNFFFVLCVVFISSSICTGGLLTKTIHNGNDNSSNKYDEDKPVGDK
ncbi:hypothetical protein SK128_006454, partial [Halocaridina rubra]